MKVICTVIIIRMIKGAKQMFGYSYVSLCKHVELSDARRELQMNLKYKVTSSLLSNTNIDGQNIP